MKPFQNLEFEETDYNKSQNYGKFTLTPLERGFGVTLGNAMRRVLISSIPGSSIFAVKIDGAMHEFTALDGVVEDVTAIILNLKELVITIDTDVDDSVKVLSLDVEGPRTVTAADLILPSDVTVINPDLVIAHVAEGGSLKMTIQCNKGRGYLTNENNKDLINIPLGTIPTDSAYSPITKVNYTIEPTRVEGNYDYDKLILEVWTNGAIQPHEAVALAAEILIEHLETFRNLSEGAKEIAVFDTAKSEPKEAVENIPIENLELSVRSYNCLKRAGISTVQELCNKTEEEMMKVRNLGKKSLKEVKDKLIELNFNFRDAK